MLRKDFESSGATFRHDAPILSRGQVHDTYRAWRSGETIPSRVTAIGFIALTPEEQYLFGRTEMLGTNYSLLPTASRLARNFSRIRGLLLDVVLHDASLERGGLGSDLKIRAFGGYYQPGNHEPWHSDDDPRNNVRYVVCHGESPTRGTIGTVNRGNIAGDGPDRGDLLDQHLVRPGGQLEPVEFEAGTILRFGPDIHAGGSGKGPRILHQVTLTVPG
jgi:hypothetical protein